MSALVVEELSQQTPVPWARSCCEEADVIQGRLDEGAADSASGVSDSVGDEEELPDDVSAEFLEAATPFTVTCVHPNSANVAIRGGWLLEEQTAAEGEILDVGQHSQGKAAMGIGCPLPVKRMECGDQCNTKPDISDVDSLIANSSAPLCSLVRLVGGKDQVGTACVSAGACGENVEPMQQAVPEPQDSDASVGELLSRSQFEQRRDNNSHMVELFTTCNSNTLTNENEASHMVPDSVGALEEAPNAVDCSDANTQVDEVTHHVSESNSRGSEAQQAPEMTVEMDPAAEYEASLPPTSAMATQTQQCPVLCIENIDSKPQGQQEDSHARDLSEDVPRSMSQGSKSGMASMREMCPVEGQQSNLVDQGAECVTPGEVPSQRTKDPEPRTSAETGALPDASATLRKAATKPRRRTEAEKLALFAWDERVQLHPVGLSFHRGRAISLRDTVGYHSSSTTASIPVISTPSPCATISSLNPSSKPPTSGHQSIVNRAASKPTRKHQGRIITSVSGTKSEDGVHLQNPISVPNGSRRRLPKTSPSSLVNVNSSSSGCESLQNPQPCSAPTIRTPKPGACRPKTRTKPKSENESRATSSKAATCDITPTHNASDSTRCRTPTACPLRAQSASAGPCSTSRRPTPVSKSKSAAKSGQHNLEASPYSQTPDLVESMGIPNRGQIQCDTPSGAALSRMSSFDTPSPRTSAISPAASSPGCMSPTDQFLGKQRLSETLQLDSRVPDQDKLKGVRSLEAPMSPRMVKRKVSKRVASSLVVSPSTDKKNRSPQKKLGVRSKTIGRERTDMNEFDGGSSSDNTRPRTGPCPNNRHEEHEGNPSSGVSHPSPGSAVESEEAAGKSRKRRRPARRGKQQGPSPALHFNGRRGVAGDEDFVVNDSDSGAASGASEWSDPDSDNEPARRPKPMWNARSRDNQHGQRAGDCAALGEGDDSDDPLAAAALVLPGFARAIGKGTSKRGSDHCAGVQTYSLQQARGSKGARAVHLDSEMDTQDDSLVLAAEGDTPDSDVEGSFEDDGMMVSDNDTSALEEKSDASLERTNGVRAFRVDTTLAPRDRRARANQRPRLSREALKRMRDEQVKGYTSDPEHLSGEPAEIHVSPVQAHLAQAPLPAAAHPPSVVADMSNLATSPSLMEREEQNGFHGHFYISESKSDLLRNRIPQTMSTPRPLAPSPRHTSHSSLTVQADSAIPHVADGNSHTPLLDAAAPLSEQDAFYEQLERQRQMEFGIARSNPHQPTRASAPRVSLSGSSNIQGGARLRAVVRAAPARATSLGCPLQTVQHHYQGAIRSRSGLSSVRRSSSSRSRPATRAPSRTPPEYCARSDGGPPWRPGEGSLRHTNSEEGLDCSGEELDSQGEGQTESDDSMVVQDSDEEAIREHSDDSQERTAGKRSTYQKPLSVERDPDARQAQRNRLAECAQVRATAAMVLQHGLKETMQNQYLVPRHAAPTQARKRRVNGLSAQAALPAASGPRLRLEPGRAPIQSKMTFNLMSRPRSIDTAVTESSGMLENNLLIAPPAEFDPENPAASMRLVQELVNQFDQLGESGASTALSSDQKTYWTNAITQMDNAQGEGTNFLEVLDDALSDLRVHIEPGTVRMMCVSEADWDVIFSMSRLYSMRTAQPTDQTDVQLDALQPHPLLHSNCTRLWKLVLGVFGRCKYFEAPEHGRAYLHAAMRRVWVLASEWPLESGFESPLMLLRMWLKSPLVDSVVPCCALADAARDLSQSDTSCAKVLLVMTTCLQRALDSRTRKMLLSRMARELQPDPQQKQHGIPMQDKEGLHRIKHKMAMLLCLNRELLNGTNHDELRNLFHLMNQAIDFDQSSPRARLVVLQTQAAVLEQVFEHLVRKLPSQSSHKSASLLLAKLMPKIESMDSIGSMIRLAGEKNLHSTGDGITEDCVSATAVLALAAQLLIALFEAEMNPKCTLDSAWMAASDTVSGTPGARWFSTHLFSCEQLKLQPGRVRIAVPTYTNLMRIPLDSLPLPLVAMVADRSRSLSSSNSEEPSCEMLTKWLLFASTEAGEHCELVRGTGMGAPSLAYELACRSHNLASFKAEASAGGTAWLASCGGFAAAVFEMLQQRWESWSASARSFLCQDLWHMLEACSVRSSSMSLQCRGPTAPAPALPPHEVLRKHLVLAFIQHAPTILMALVTSQHPTQAGQSRNFPTGRLTRLVEVCAAGDTRSRIPGTSQRGAEQLAVQGVVWALQTAKIDIAFKKTELHWLVSFVLTEAASSLTKGLGMETQPTLCSLIASLAGTSHTLDKYVVEQILPSILRSDPRGNNGTSAAALQVLLYLAPVPWAVDHLRQEFRFLLSQDSLMPIAESLPERLRRWTVPACLVPVCSFLLTVIESVVDGERYVEHSCTRVALNLIAHVLCPPAGFPHVSINKPVLDARTEKLVGVMVDFAVWVLAAWAPQDPLIANRAKDPIFAPLSRNNSSKLTLQVKIAELESLRKRRARNVLQGCTAIRENHSIGPMQPIIKVIKTPIQAPLLVPISHTARVAKKVPLVDAAMKLLEAVVRRQRDDTAFPRFLVPSNRDNRRYCTLVMTKEVLGGCREGDEEWYGPSARIGRLLHMVMEMKN